MSLNEMLEERKKIQSELEQKAGVITQKINGLNQKLAEINKEYLENKGQIDLLDELIEKNKKK